MELDKFKDVDLVLDRANDTFIAKQVVSHGDYLGRTSTVQITNGGLVGALPGAQLVLHWKNMASGLSDDSAYTLIDAENTIFRIEYPQNMLTPGTVKANILVIYQGKTTVSREFEITVANVAGQSTGVLAKAEFSALVAALSEANGWGGRIGEIESTKADIVDVTDKLLKKADKSFVDAQFSAIVSGSPKGTYTTLSALKAAYPNGADGIFLVLENGHWYYYASGWKDGGLYQAEKVANDSIGVGQLIDSSIIPTKLDAKTLEIITHNQIERAYTFSADLTNVGKTYAEMTTVDSIPENRVVINVNDTLIKQKFIGMGASITPASAYLLMTSLTAQQRHSLLSECFSPQEGYFRTTRISVAGTDFTNEDTFRSYNDTADDFEMTNFSIGADVDYVIPVLREILDINHNVMIHAAVWSPPAWMKTNNNMTLGGSLIDDEKYYEAFALYLHKFIDAYQNYGIPIHQISPANEGTYAFDYPTSIWTGASMGNFIKNYLSVRFDKYNVKTKIQIFDTNYYEGEYLQDLLDSPAKDYADTIGFHSYSGDFSDIANILRPHKNLELHFTEKRTMAADTPAEKFQNIVRDVMFKGLVGGVQSVTLWNFALDENGKPTHNKGLARRGVVTIQSNGSITRNMEYYFLRMFNQFTKAGAKIVESSKQGFHNGVASVAIKNEDGSIALYLYNDTTSTAVVYSRMRGKIYRTNIPAQSVNVLTVGENMTVKNPNRDGILPKNVKTSPNFVTSKTTNRNQKVLYLKKTVNSGDSILLFVGRMDASSPDGLLYSPAAVLGGLNMERRFTKIDSIVAKNNVSTSQTFYRVLDVYILQNCEAGTHNISIKYNFEGTTEDNNNFGFNAHVFSVGDYASYSIESTTSSKTITNSTEHKYVFTAAVTQATEAITQVGAAKYLTSDSSNVSSVNLQTLVCYDDGASGERGISWSSANSYLTVVANVYFD